MFVSTVTIWSPSDRVLSVLYLFDFLVHRNYALEVTGEGGYVGRR